MKALKGFIKLRQHNEVRKQKFKLIFILIQLPELHGAGRVNKWSIVYFLSLSIRLTQDYAWSFILNRQSNFTAGVRHSTTLKGPYLGCNLFLQKASHKNKHLCKILFQITFGVSVMPS